MPGVKVTLTNEKTGQTHTWLYEDGLQGYLREHIEDEPLIPYFGGEWFAPAGDETYAKGEGATHGCWHGRRKADWCVKAM